nr:methyltransferase domain-containing protein [uncultured Flavobacterium sp.]
MFINTKYRSTESEIMDDFALEGEILRDALDKIAKINQLLGGNQLTLLGVQDLLRNIPKTNEIVIVDVGCGNGDMLRTLADYGIKNSVNFRLIGIDANNFTINHARKLSESFSNISYRCEDVFDKPFEELKYDIVLCTLTLHHFKEDDILQLMRVFNANSRIGIVINDLQRSAVAYRLFQVLCFVFRLNSMSREDGLTSILRGFKKEELVNFSKKLKLNNYIIQWKWAFRYQWIISKL